MNSLFFEYISRRTGLLRNKDYLCVMKGKPYMEFYEESKNNCYPKDGTP